MAKLNKQEISAIAEDIYEKINAPINEYNALVSSNDAFKMWEITFDKSSKGKELINLYDTVDLLNEKAKKYKYSKYGSTRTLNIGITENLEYVKRELFKETIKYKPNKGDISLIERELIIAQAKNTDVDAMIASILEKYK